jgi:hypothetical protein
VGARTATGIGGPFTTVTVTALLLTVPQLRRYEPEQDRW